MSQQPRETPSRFVAYFDMLGMAALTVATSTLAWWLLTWLTIWRDSVLGLQYGKRRGFFVDFHRQIDQVAFSDSTVLFTKSDKEKDLAAILISAGDLFVAALKDGIPLRSGIAHGAFIHNHEKSMYVGSALVRAHHISETAKWLGVVVDDDVARLARLSPLRIAGGRPIIRRWPVPVSERRSEPHYVLSWPVLFHQDFPAVTHLTTRGLYSRFAPFFGPFAKQPRRIRQKYVNTAAFLNAALGAET